MSALRPGDIALAVEVLSRDAAMRRIAAKDYARHPAVDEFEKSINHARSAKAEADAASVDRVITYLAGGEHHG